MASIPKQKANVMQSKKFKVRDLRKKDQFIIDDFYLNSYAMLVGPAGTCVYLSLCRHADKEQKCWPSERKIAEEHGVSNRTVIRGVRNLKKYNIIAIERGKRDRDGTWLPNIYFLLDKSQWKTPSDNMSHGKPKIESPGDKPCDTPSDKPCDTPSDILSPKGALKDFRKDLKKDLKKELKVVDRTESSRPFLISHIKTFFKTLGIEIKDNQIKALVDQYGYDLVVDYINKLATRLEKAYNPVGLLFSALNEKWEISDTVAIKLYVDQCQFENPNCVLNYADENPRDFHCYWCDRFYGKEEF